MSAPATSHPMTSLVAAVAENGVIGCDNRLPWHLSADLAHFKRLTLDKPIVMGRRTFESLPGLLPRRRHIVLSRDPKFRPAGAVAVGSLEEALVAAGDVPEVMIVGGAGVFARTLPGARRLYLTLVHARVEGDTHFPSWDPNDWREIERGGHAADARNDYAMTFLTYERAVPADQSSFVGDR